MNGRERLQHILNRQPTDRLSWTTLVDPVTLSTMSEPERSMSSLDFYRRIGCDVLQFGNYGLPEDCAVQSPARAVWPDANVEQTQLADGVIEIRRRSPWGDLVSRHQGSHPIKYPVESVAEVRVLRDMWQAMRYEEVPGHAESFQRAEARIGEQGLYVPTLAPSPVQQLIEEEMGQENFYYLLQDEPREVEALLDVMHDRRKKEYELLLRTTPAPAVIPVENTSSMLTSPAIYERYSLPQIRDYCDIAHRHGKKVVPHMCGHLRHLLPIIQRAGADGYNATTPPTTGDTPLETTLDLLGEDTVFWGGIFNGNVFQKPGVTRDEMWRALDDLYTPRLRRAHLCLWFVADGLPTPLERFLWVAEWMERHGSL